jgi:hypothetical protein
MKISRFVIASVVFLVSGIWTILAYCHGTTGMSFAVPVQQSNLRVDFTTTGVAVAVGIPLVAVGLFLLAIALIASIVVQFLPSREPAVYEETPSSSKRVLSLNE